jgi:phospholipase/carboxylesterase
MSDLSHVHLFEPGDQGAPTLLLLHGTGGDERDLLPLGPLLLPGAALLSVRGNVDENGMPRFFRRHAEGVFDEDDVVRRTGELADFVGEAAEHYSLDPARVVAAGFSNGANTAAAMMLLHPGVVATAVLLAPMPVLDERLPAPLPDLTGHSAFLGAGRLDPLAPPRVAQELADTLAAAGAAVELRFHGGGHTVDRGNLASARSWLSAALAPELAPRMPG